MPPKLRGKWALGITPRNFTWILKDRLAVCERPGGYGDNHRRVRRQEEIIWIRENHFGCLISIIPAPHNLHNYDELNVNYQHRPYNNENNEKIDEWARGLFKELKKLLTNNVKVIVHGEEVGDIIMGAMAAFVRWQGMIEDPIEAIAIGEKHDGRVVQARHYAAGVLPRRFQFLKDPALALVGAAVQAAVGGGIDPTAATWGRDHGNPMHVRRHQALVEQLPGLAVVSAAVDATNFNRGPHHPGCGWIEQNLRHPRGAHVDV